jgi:hypothetical protein
MPLSERQNLYNSTLHNLPSDGGASGGYAIALPRREDAILVQNVFTHPSSFISDGRTCLSMMLNDDEIG